VTPVVVVISSVPWRRANLLALVNDLAVQTLQPAKVLIHFDGYARGEVPDWDDLPYWAQQYGLVTMTRCTVPCGPGERWRRLLQHPHVFQNPDVLVLDDDFRIEPGYIERTVAELATHDGAVAWSGARLADGDYIDWRGYEPHELMSISAGSCALRLAWLRGVTDYEFIDDYFKVGGDDEALVSYHLWRKGVRMWRPSGAAPLFSVDKFANDSRAAGLRYGFKRVASRLALHEQHGWASYKLPPSLRADWKKKPWE